MKNLKASQKESIRKVDIIKKLSIALAVSTFLSLLTSDFYSLLAAVNDSAEVQEIVGVDSSLPSIADLSELKGQLVHDLGGEFMEQASDALTVGVYRENFELVGVQLPFNINRRFLKKLSGLNMSLLVDESSSQGTDEFPVVKHVSFFLSPDYADFWKNSEFSFYTFPREEVVAVNLNSYSEIGKIVYREDKGEDSRSNVKFGYLLINEKRGEIKIADVSSDIKKVLDTLIGTVARFDFTRRELKASDASDFLVRDPFIDGLMNRHLHPNTLWNRNGIVSPIAPLKPEPATVIEDDEVGVGLHSFSLSSVVREFEGVINTTYNNGHNEFTLKLDNEEIIQFHGTSDFYSMFTKETIAQSRVAVKLVYFVGATGYEAYVQEMKMIKRERPVGSQSNSDYIYDLGAQGPL